MDRTKIHTYFENVTSVKHPKAYENREWCWKAIENPIRREVQPNGRIRHWIWLPHEEKYLRVITLADGETLFNAMFDRRFKP